MKSFKEFITEKWHDTAPPQYKNSPPVDIYKNPSKSELHKIIHSSNAHSARAILHGDDCYAWDAMHAIHHEIDDHLKLGSGPGSKKYVNISKDRWGSEYANERTHKDHPWVKKTIPNHRFFEG